MKNRTMLWSDVAHFDSFGWILIPEFFSIDEMLSCDRWCDDVYRSPLNTNDMMIYCEDQVNSGGQRIVKRIEYFCDLHTGFREFLRRGRHVPTVESLLGGPSVLFKEKINSKYPGGSAYRVHQDQQAGWTEFAPLFVNAMICLDDITSANGGFCISHCVRQRQLIAGEWSNLSEEQAAECRMQDVEFRRGDLLLFDSFVAHGSGQNTSDVVRRALFATYNHRDHGDHREAYFSTKRAAHPPVITFNE
jgi:ectoine hydroxylase-related dioxygenase (phytanoyl-CoA dioxygenase family)